MIEYVTGFCFDDILPNVVLIRKAKPDWQKGKLNGVGGKIEPNETMHSAMVREFYEETGAKTLESDWKYYVSILGHDYKCHFFWAINHSAYASVKQTTNEPIELIPLCNLQDYNIIPNLSWLLPLARHVIYDHNNEFYEPIEVTLSYEPR